jgi:hypothetical protein
MDEILKLSPPKDYFVARIVAFILIPVFLILFTSRQGGLAVLVFQVMIGIVGILGVILSLPGVFSDRYSLILTPHGLRYGIIREIRSCAWSQIEGVYVLRSVGKMRLCLKIKNPSKPQAHVIWMPPYPYGLSAEELAKTIVIWRHRYGQNTGQASME